MWVYAGLSGSGLRGVRGCQGVLGFVFLALRACSTYSFWLTSFNNLWLGSYNRDFG